jgi:hypothetical protein
METNTAAHRLPAAITFPIAFLIIMLGGALTGIATAAFGSLIHIVLLFPIIMGFAGGNTLLAAIQLTKLRNISALFILSVLTALVIYGTYHYGGYIALQIQTSLELFSGLTPATEEENLLFAKGLVDDALEEETGRPGFTGYILLKAKNGLSVGRYYSKNRLELGSALTWLYWALEFGIILWVILRMGKKEFRIPLCDSCGKPIGREKHLGGTAPANESLLLDLLRRNDVAQLAQLIEKDAGLPSLELYMLRCESCGESSARLTVRRVTPGHGGSLQFSDLSKAVLPPGESGLFLKQLRFEVE